MSRPNRFTCVKSGFAASGVNPLRREELEDYVDFLSRFVHNAS